MSLSRKFHKRVRVDADGVARNAWDPSAENPVPSVEEVDDDDVDDINNNNNKNEPDERDHYSSYYDDDRYYYGSRSSHSPPLRVPRYVPDQPTSTIPDFSDSDAEAEFRAKVDATYKWMAEEEQRKKALPPGSAALKRKYADIPNDNNNNNYYNAADLDVEEMVDEEGEAEDVDEDEEQGIENDNDESPESAARVGMIDNLVDLLEMVGVTLNFLINVQGADIDPTDLQKVREALSNYVESEDQPWKTSAEDAPDHAEAMVERLFDMPLREFLPLAYDIAEFREELEERGISL
ncbi:hypothetical protein K445DRAFT_375807 [Daldinia sp. EC12]|nr:hypothetical protein K445DRAFT_375807 [Daldinia sp. EC12]